MSFTRKEALEIACGAKVVRNLTPSAGGVMSLYRSLILMEQAAPPILISAEAVARAAARGVATVDLRSPADFESAHLASSAAFPWAERHTIVYLLPARGTPLIVVLDSSIEPPEALAFFAGLEHRIDAFVLATPDLWAALDPALTAKGRATVRLWSPNTFLKRAMALVQSKLPQGGLAADVACGSGRDAVWVAAHAGWSVVALDKDLVLLDKVHQLATREGVSGVRTEQVDLEEHPEALAALHGRCQLVHVSRYLHRPLFPVLKAMVAPGGFVLYHTFLRGSEAFGAPKKPRYLLQPNELKEVFGEPEFVVHEYTEATLPDRRPVAFLCAQRKQAS